jgi:hypothetical protein
MARSNPHPGLSPHLQYRLAFVEDDVCTVRYDNEAGKGDHRHIDDWEEPYRFTTVEQLIADFLGEIEKRRRSR